jgi:hypothetical protein
MNYLVNTYLQDSHNGPERRQIARSIDANHAIRGLLGRLADHLLTIQPDQNTFHLEEVNRFVSTFLHFQQDLPFITIDALSPCIADDPPYMVIDGHNLLRRILSVYIRLCKSEITKRDGGDDIELMKSMHLNAYVHMRFIQGWITAITRLADEEIGAGVSDDNLDVLLNLYDDLILLQRISEETYGGSDHLSTQSDRALRNIKRYLDNYSGPREAGEL